MGKFESHKRNNERMEGVVGLCSLIGSGGR